MVEHNNCREIYSGLFTPILSQIFFVLFALGIIILIIVIENFKSRSYLEILHILQLFCVISWLISTKKFEIDMEKSVKFLFPNNHSVWKNLCKISKNINAIFTRWKKIVQRFQLYFAWNPRLKGQFGIALRFYALQSRISCKVYLEFLKHALLPYIFRSGWWVLLFCLKFPQHTVNCLKNEL